MVDSFRLLLILILILATALFVSAEFSFVRVRVSRIEQLVNEGNKKAERVLKVLNNLDGYLSACQLGITITSLALGWLGEPTIESILEPIFRHIGIPNTASQTISFVLSFFLVTFAHVIFGEMSPKIIAIQKAESLSMYLAVIMVNFYKLTYPMIWLLNGTANSLIHVFGLKTAAEHDETHSEEEIKLIVSSSSDINADEKQMLEKIFDFDETIAREIMVHRKDMNCIYIGEDLKENLKIIKESRHSRFPVCREDRDDIIGYVSIKDLYSYGEELLELDPLIRKDMPKVHESTPIKKVMKKLQKEKHQMAIVFDEYGGVSGLITMEDIIEEIVGDIQDEFDNEIPSFRKQGKSTVVEGSVHVDDVRDELNIDIEHIDGIDTIGGYVLAKLEEHPPKAGARLETEEFEIEIIETKDERISLLRIEKKDE